VRVALRFHVLCNANCSPSVVAISVGAREERCRKAPIQECRVGEALSNMRGAHHLPGLVRVRLHGVDSLRVSAAGCFERPTCHGAAKRHGGLYGDSVPEPRYAHRVARLCRCTGCDAIRLLQGSSEASDTSRMYGALLRRAGTRVVAGRSGHHARAFSRRHDSGPVGFWSTP
jgi:hypothetical protein